MSLKDVSAVWRARPTQDFPRGPDKMTMGVICVFAQEQIWQGQYGTGVQTLEEL